VEFFAFIFLIVYVGAIAVLFLFIVMTLDIKIVNVSQKIQDFFSYKSILVLLILLNLLIFLHEDYKYLGYTFVENTFLHEYIDYSKYLKPENHLEIIGKALYTEYIIPFLYCGFILFIAMVGAIVLTLDKFTTKTIKQQDPVIQGLKNNEASIFNFKIYLKSTNI